MDSRPGADEAFGAVLGDALVREYLGRGELFAKTDPQCWTETNLRAARYDLRLAPDRLVIPTDPSIDASGFEWYPRDKKLPSSRAVELEPGAVALVSTEEKFCMPWDVSGTIALRFELARRGLVALAGLFVDPGFGQQDESSRREAEVVEERLHLLLANLGTETIALRPYDGIASIQFVRVARATPGRPPRTTSAIDDEYFRTTAKKGPELGFVRRLREAADATKDLGTRLNRIEDSIDRYAVFGVFLIATALIAAFGTVFVKTLDSIKSKGVVDWLLPHQGGLRALVLVVFIVATFVLLYKLFSLPYRAFENLLPRVAKPRLSRIPSWRRRQRIRQVLMSIREDEWTTADDVAIAVCGTSSYRSDVEGEAMHEKALLGSWRVLHDSGELPNWTTVSDRPSIRARLEAEGLPFDGEHADPRHRIRYRDLLTRAPRDGSGNTRSPRGGQ